MARTVPNPPGANAGALVTAELWNNGPKALNDFLLNKPTFLGQQGTSSSVSNTTWTAVPLNTNFIDTDGGHNVAVNNTRYTVQVAGWYWVVGMVAWNTGIPAGTFRMEGAVAKNSNIIAGSSQFLSIITQGPSAVATSSLVACNIGDYLEIWGRQSTGATQNFDNGSVTDGITRTCYCMMNAIWIRS